VVVRRSRPGTPPAPRLLASVVGALADHTLVHFKGPTDELERDDAPMLLAYALQYLVVAEIADPALVALRVVAPRLTRGSLRRSGRWTASSPPPRRASTRGGWGSSRCG
jgi:hypothetical protein